MVLSKNGAIFSVLFEVRFLLHYCTPRFKLGYICCSPGRHGFLSQLLELKNRKGPRKFRPLGEKREKKSKKKTALWTPPYNLSLWNITCICAIPSQTQASYLCFALIKQQIPPFFQKISLFFSFFFSSLIFLKISKLLQFPSPHIIPQSPTQALISSLWSLQTYSTIQNEAFSIWTEQT